MTSQSVPLDTERDAIVALLPEALGILRAIEFRLETLPPNLVFETEQILCSILKKTKKLSGAATRELLLSPFKAPAVPPDSGERGVVYGSAIKAVGDALNLTVRDISDILQREVFAGDLSEESERWKNAQIEVLDNLVQHVMKICAPAAVSQ